MRMESLCQYGEIPMQVTSVPIPLICYIVYAFVAKHSNTLTNFKKVNQATQSYWYGLHRFIAHHTYQKTFTYFSPDVSFSITTAPASQTRQKKRPSSSSWKKVSCSPTSVAGHAARPQLEKVLGILGKVTDDEHIVSWCC